MWRLEIWTGKGSDARKWQAAIERMGPGLGDVYFTPGYCHTSEYATGWPARLAFFGDEQDFVIFPFQVRDLRELPFWNANKEGDGLFDIVSPYGYSGPITMLTDTSVREQLIEKFFQEFDTYCVSNAILTEFIRLHPLICNHELVSRVARIDPRNVTVWMDLSKPQEELDRETRKGHRGSIAKARKNHLEVEVSTREADLYRFWQLYTATMHRRGAGSSYFFPYRFFQQTIDLLGDNASLFVTRRQGKVLSAALFLHNSYYVHYHFSGSSVEGMQLGAMPLLLCEVARRAKQKGCRVFHLGGGMSNDDTLFLFKAGFSRNRSQFYTCSRVHDTNRYLELCAARRSFDAIHNPFHPGDRNYFPEYRKQPQSL